MIESAFIYGATGIIVGFIAGVLGIGGGMILVPALLYIFHYTNDVPHDIAIHYAAGTSLAIMVFTAQASVIAHQRKKGVSWSIYQHIIPGIAIGTVMGAALSNQIPTHWLKIILGLVLLFIASEMVFKPHFSTRTNFPSPWINRFVSVIIGLKSGLLGIGGGALIIPYLSYCGVERRETAGISSMCTLTVALIGTVMFIITGLMSGESVNWSTGYVYWPAVLWFAIPSMLFAPIGAYFTYRLPIDYLKYAFIVVLVIAAIDLLR